MDADRLRRALDALVYLPSLTGAPDPAAPACAAVAAAVTARTGRAPAPPARPWDRGDLHRRLATFSAATWFAKPKGAQAGDAAARGWANAGPDLLACEVWEDTGGGRGGGRPFRGATPPPPSSQFCGQRLSLPLPPDMAPDDVTKVRAWCGCVARGGRATARHAAHHPPSLRLQAGARFAARLVDAHAPACPWRGTGCDPGLAAFPALTRGAVVRAFESAVGAASALTRLPPLASSAYDRIAGEAGERLETLLQAGVQPEGLRSAVPPGPAPEREAGVAAAGTIEFERRCRLLALYGLEARVVAPAAGRGPAAGRPRGSVRAVDAALGCSLCGGVAGLWAHVPLEEDVGAGGGGGAAAADADTPPPAKRTRAAAAAAAAPTPPSPWPPTGAGAASPTPLDPATVHRHHCAWAAPPHPGARVGWRWCLHALVPGPGPHEEGGGDGDGACGGGAAAAARLRAVLRRGGLGGAGASPDAPRLDVLTVGGEVVEEEGGGEEG